MKKKTLLKGMAWFFAIEMIVSAVVPTRLYALTAGPTSPEASSFEPVDTTDMVNLPTGDFVYNLPLMEVPGPAGGFPVSLSYHARVMPNVEASWVGLGFTLNPGAINRSVSGYADDFEGLVDSDRSFWEGGSTTTYTLGVSTGYGFGPSVDAGLIYADDTYKGQGLGYYAGVSDGFASIKHGVSPYGESSTDLSINASSRFGKSQNIAGQLALSMNQRSEVTVSAGLTLNQSQGIDISSGRGGFSISGGRGFAISGGIQNSKVGNISTSGYNYTATVPTPWNFCIRIGKSYTRYWSDETETIPVFGALYFPKTVSDVNTDAQAFDVYDMVNPVPKQSAIVPDENMAGAFVDYDHYQVLGQGISGTIRPFHYTSYLLRQNKKRGDLYRVKTYPLQGNAPAAFRFDGDFSNRFVHDAAKDAFNTNGSPSLPLQFQFDPNRVTGEGGDDGYDAGSNVLAGSRETMWFTNAQVADKGGVDDFGNSIEPGNDAAIRRGFIDCHATGFGRDADSKIGGIRVRNASGVSYHYALPVYSYNEFTYSGRADDRGKISFNLYSRKNPYAYTWLLTAMTGPDYVDVNNNGYADKGDTGYWVTFEYGKWTSKYTWRNPAEGTQKDIDRTFDNLSKGFKEVYYLNSITTATHKALFVKELRKDGKSVVDAIDGVIKDGDDHTVADLDKGGFTPIQKLSGNGNPYTEYPVSTLRLAAIYLLKTEDIESLGEVSLEKRADTYYDAFAHFLPGMYTLGRNVLDVHDAAEPALANVLKTKALRAIRFNTDYSLCGNTSNSFVSRVDNINTDERPSTTTYGKLTLKSVTFIGRMGAHLLPDVAFEYDDPRTFYGSATPHNTADQRRITIASDAIKRESFVPGEIVKHVDIHNRSNYAYIDQMDANAGTLDLVAFSGPWESNATPMLRFEITKNPPYNKDMYDLWGNYKVDYAVSPEGWSTTVENRESEDVKRMVTRLSAQSVDVWSLRRIRSSLGATVEIGYESDTYTSAIRSLANIPIKNIELLPSGDTKITLYEQAKEYELEAGKNINMRLMTAIGYEVQPGRDALRFNCGSDQHTNVYKWILDTTFEGASTIAIESVEGNTIVVPYNYTDRFPLNGGEGISRDQPYKSDHITDKNRPYYIDLSEMNVTGYHFMGGEIMADVKAASRGGGIRVTHVSVNSWGTKRSTLYHYENGVTSYEPLGLEVPIKPLEENMYSCLQDVQKDMIAQYRNHYINDVYTRFKGLFVNARELPGPEVLYERVTAQERIENESGVVDLPGKIEYLFEVFAPLSVDLNGSNSHALNKVYGSPFEPTPAKIPHTTPTQEILGLAVNKISPDNRATLRNLSALLGSLKAITTFDKDGNKITETRSHYLHDDFKEETFQEKLHGYRDQGVVTETFADARIILNDDTADDPRYTLYGLLSHRVAFPAIQTGQTTTNYKTGVVTTTTNQAFDFYSGDVTETVALDGYGNSYLSKSLPAYRVYPSLQNANMLTQQAATYRYKIEGNDAAKKIGLVSASLQTWSDQIQVLPSENGPYAFQNGIWRKQSVYNFIGNETVALRHGLYPADQFLEWNGTTFEGWQKQSEATRYDVHSHERESKDINDHYASTKFSCDQSRVVAACANASLQQFAYAGAEEAPLQVNDGPDKYFCGNVKAEGQRSGDKAHTGAFSIKAPPGTTALSYELNASARTYVFSVWASTPQVAMKASLDNTAQVLNAKVLGHANGWYLLQAEVTAGADQKLKVWCESKTDVAYVDDFRMYPLDAAMTSYVYNTWGELSHILDGNNLYTEFHYDDMGRLTETYREKLNTGTVKVSQIQYHYANQD